MVDEQLGSHLYLIPDEVRSTRDALLVIWEIEMQYTSRAPRIGQASNYLAQTCRAIHNPQQELTGYMVGSVPLTCLRRRWWKQ